RELADELDQRQEQRDDDEADDPAQDDDHDRLQEAHEALDQDLDLLIVVVGDLVEHGIQIAGLLADVDHVDHDVVDDPRLAQGLGDRLALADTLVDPRERPLEDGVAGGVADDVQGLQNRHARLDQRAEGAHRPGHGRLLDDRPHHRDHQPDAVEDVGPGAVAVEQLDDDPDQDRRQQDHPEPPDDEVAGLDQEDGHLGQVDPE